MSIRFKIPFDFSETAYTKMESIFIKTLVAFYDFIENTNYAFGMDFLFIYYVFLPCAKIHVYPICEFF